MDAETKERFERIEAVLEVIDSRLDRITQLHEALAQHEDRLNRLEGGK